MQKTKRVGLVAILILAVAGTQLPISVVAQKKPAKKKYNVLS